MGLWDLGWIWDAIGGWDGCAGHVSFCLLSAMEACCRECFWASHMWNIMKPQGDCLFPRRSAKTLSGGRAWNVLGLFSGACRCLGENEGDSQVSQKLKTLEQSQKRPHAIIIRGAHDNCSHGSKCLMGLRPGGGAWLIAAPNYPSTARIRPSLSDSASHQD